MTAVVHYQMSDLTGAQAQKIAVLVNAIWPEDKSVDELIEDMAANSAGREVFVVWDNDMPIAHAEIFSRTLGLENGELVIMAIGVVCVDEQRRGEGLSRDVMNAVFAQVDSGRYPVALLQTAIPDYYAKLGCKLVENEWWNSQADNPKAYPWYDPNIMIYPDNADWPTGRIDLNGRDF